MVEPYESRRQKKPTGAVKPMAPVVQPQTRSYPMYPGSSEWDTAPGWLARAGGVNTSTPEGRMFAAMNRPSVPVAKPAAPTGPSPWDIGTAAMNLGSPEMVKPNAMPSPVDPFSVPLTPENFNEVWGARKAQIASSMPALAPRSPVQMPAMPANPSPLGTYANPDRGGYRFGNATTRPYGQSMPTMRPMDPGMRAVAMASAMRHPWQPNISIPGGAEAVAEDEAKRRKAATLAQSFDRLRERSKAVPPGTYLAGTPETIANLTKYYPWEGFDPAKAITETMTYDEWLMKNRAQKAAMEQGRPFDLVPIWIGPTGRPRSPSTWDLAKKHKSTRKDGSKVADVIRSRAAERKLKEEPRRAMVTAKAQGRRISPVQAGIEAALTAGRGLTEDQLRAAYGPTYDQIQAQREDSSNKLLAGIAAAIGGAMQPGPNGEPAASPLTISSIFGPLLNRAMGQEGGAPTMPWMQGSGSDTPQGAVNQAMSQHPEIATSFYKAIGDPNTDEDVLRRFLYLAEVPEDMIEQWIQGYSGKKPTSAIVGGGRPGGSKVGNPAGEFQRPGAY